MQAVVSSEYGELDNISANVILGFTFWFGVAIIIDTINIYLRSYKMLYFDHAATSFPKPKCVIEACADAMAHAGNPGRGAHTAALWSARCIYHTREAVGRLFGCSPDGVVFTQNATMALNEAITQIDGEILTTAMEHNSVLRPLYCRGGYRIVTAPGGVLEPDNVIRAITPETKAVIMTHASNLTGEIYDISAVGRACREKGILFIVDAAQTAGVVPVDVEAMCVDMLAFSGHKGTLGPTGTGGLVLGSRILNKEFDLRPLLCGGTGSQSRSLKQPCDLPDLLEAGTQNVHGLAGLCAGISYILDIGVETILAHEQRLVKLFIDGIRSLPGMVIYRPDCRRVGTVALNVADVSPAELCEWLAMENVCVRGGAHCAPLAHDAIGTGESGAVRFSFGWTTTEQEVQKGIDILKHFVS